MGVQNLEGAIPIDVSVDFGNHTSKEHQQFRTQDSKSRVFKEM